MPRDSACRSSRATSSTPTRTARACAPAPRSPTLTDAHRAEWLDRLGAELGLRPGGAVLTCSALKASYRDRLRAAAPGLRFAWLDLDPASAQARVAQRSAHFFPAGLVATQFDALESPLGEPGVLRLDALLLPEVLAERVVRWVTSTD